MTQEWAIALVGIFGTAALGIAGWGAASLWGIHKDLRNFVLKSDCERDMDNHCGRLDCLTQDLTELSRQVAVIEKSVDMYQKK